MAKQCNIGTIMDHLSPNSYRGGGGYSGEHQTLNTSFKGHILRLILELHREKTLVRNHLKGFSGLKRCHNVITIYDLMGPDSMSLFSVHKSFST